MPSTPSVSAHSIYGHNSMRRENLQAPLYATPPGSSSRRFTLSNKLAPASIVSSPRTQAIHSTAHYSSPFLLKQFADPSPLQRPSTAPTKGKPLSLSSAGRDADMRVYARLRALGNGWAAGGAESIPFRSSGTAPQEEQCTPSPPGRGGSAQPAKLTPAGVAPQMPGSRRRLLQDAASFYASNSCRSIVGR